MVNLFIMDNYGQIEGIEIHQTLREGFLSAQPIQTIFPIKFLHQRAHQ